MIIDYLSPVLCSIPVSLVCKKRVSYRQAVVAGAIAAVVDELVGKVVINYLGLRPGLVPNLMLFSGVLYSGQLAASTINPNYKWTHSLCRIALETLATQTALAMMVPPQLRFHSPFNHTH